MRCNKQVSRVLAETALYLTGFTFQYKEFMVLGVGCTCELLCENTCGVM